MIDQLERYQKYSRFMRRLLLTGGLWPIATKRKGTRILYNLISVVGVVLCVCVSYGLLRFCQVNVCNMAMYTKTLSIFGSTSNVCLKLIYFYIYRREFREMITILDGLFKEILKDSDFRSTAFPHLGQFYYATNFSFYTVFCTSLSYGLAPYILILRQYTKNVEPIRCTTPYPTSYPLEMENCGTLYKLVAFFETSLFAFFMTVTPGVDTFFGHCMFQMSAVLRTMSRKFETLNSDNCESVMAKCVEQHNLLLRCRSILQKSFSPIILYICITNAVILCALIFQAYQVITINNCASFISYISLKLSQAFLYAWYGSLITSESQAFRDSVYSSKWHVLGNKSFMKGVLTILSQKTMMISAYNFYPVTMELFTGIINTTVSYFFLLKTLEEAMDVSTSIE